MSDETTNYQFYTDGYTDGYANKEYNPYRLLTKVTQENDIDIMIKEYAKGYETGKFNAEIDEKNYE
jgi:hypothetical protein